MVRIAAVVPPVVLGNVAKEASVSPGKKLFVFISPSCMQQPRIVCTSSTAIHYCSVSCLARTRDRKIAIGIEHSLLRPYLHQSRARVCYRTSFGGGGAYCNAADQSD